MTEKSDEITLKEPEPGETPAPLWVDEVIVDDEKHIRVELWAPSEKYPQYSYTLRLVERRKINGEWKRTTMILPKDPSTLLVTEAVDQVWAKLRELVEEG